MKTNEKTKNNFFERFNKYKIILCVLLVVYTIVSFVRLGNIKSPKTFANLLTDESVVYEIEDGAIPTSVVFFGGYDNSFFSIFLAQEYVSSHQSFEYDSSVDTDFMAVYSWEKKEFNLDKKACKYVMLSSYADSTVLGEVAFLDENNNIIKTRLIEGTDLLNDEQDLIQVKKNYLNSTYFDEIYYSRAAYEMFNNKYIFEFTHPPLGKIIMWIPMALFGISPFSFRLMGNISGILMIFVMYELAKELFKEEKYALFAAFIIALDGMHFAQTRIATVDTFLVLFGMISILFFIKYLNSKNDSEKKKYIYLGLSGIAWGCAVATKWNSCYIGLGLGILFFVNYIRNEKIVINKKFNYKPILMGALCFVVIPILVYVASYIPVFCNSSACAPYDVFDAEGNKTAELAYPNSIKGFIMYQYAMYQYHSSIGKAADYTPHPFSSSWYTWPVIYKPMWFTVDTYENGLKSTIVSMGNPIIWWLSIATLVIMCFYLIIEDDGKKEGWTILILILSTWLPYVIISREMYIYHYFLTSILMMLTIVFAVSKMIQRKPKYKFVIPVLIIVFLISFIYFYPVYSGMSVSEEYIDSTKWVSSWVY